MVVRVVVGVEVRGSGRSVWKGIIIVCSIKIMLVC